MKLDSILKINVSALKDALGSKYSVNAIKNDLRSVGATVEGQKDDDGIVYMYISGDDVDVEDIESVFDEAGVDVNDFVVDEPLDECDGVSECDNDECDDELGECSYPKYEDVKECDSEDVNECNEKKKDCCPKKKYVNENKISEIRKIRKQKPNVLVPLKEALSSDVKKTAKSEVPTVNAIIDHLVGKKNTKSVSEAAINKAKKESGRSLNEGLEFLKEKLGEKLYNKICEAIKNDKKCLHENITINKKKLVEYTLDELKSIYEKALAQVKSLKSKSTDGLNEADANKIQQNIMLKERLVKILSEEIEYRSAILEADEDEDKEFVEPMMNLDPNEGKKKDDDDEKENDEEDADDDKSDDPDSDEEVEIGSIVITLASKQAAEDLKNDLISASVPEDVIEIEAVQETEEEDETSEEGAEEETENASDKEEKTEESLKFKGSKLNEEDEEEKEEDEEKSDEKTEGENEEEDGEEEDEEGTFKVILVDTDYAPTLRDVLADRWGLSNEEFAEMIGGDIIEDDNDDEKKEDDSESKESESSDEGEDDEFDPDEIFKNV